MTEPKDVSSDKGTEDNIESIKGNRARGTWALIALIFLVFGIARWFMTGTAP